MCCWYLYYLCLSRSLSMSLQPLSTPYTPPPNLTFWSPPTHADPGVCLHGDVRRSGGSVLPNGWHACRRRDLPVFSHPQYDHVWDGGLWPQTETLPSQEHGPGPQWIPGWNRYISIPWYADISKCIYSSIYLDILIYFNIPVYHKVKWWNSK